MKNKILLVLTTILVVCMLSFTLTACGESRENEPTHTHDYTIIKNDSVNHWSECFCGEKSNAEAHKGGIATETQKAICEVCNTEYGEKHAHYYTTLKNNATEHWYECSCGAKSFYEFHKGGTATCTQKAICTGCNTEYGDFKHDYVILKYNENEHWNECSCGAKRGLENHNYATLKHNEVEHWEECSCGAKNNVESHKGGEATCTEKAVCNICFSEYGVLKEHNCDNLKHNEEKHWYECECSYKSNIEEHKYSTLKYDDTEHWQECSCGATSNIEEHKYSTLKYDDTEHWQECSCGAMSNVVEHKYSTLKYDDNEHWQECSCGVKSNIESHKGGTATCTELAVCSVCNESYGKFGHKHTTLKYDDTKHWYECVCGDKTTPTTHVGGTATYTEKAKCSVCNSEYGELKTSTGLRYQLINNDTEYEIIGIGACEDSIVYIPAVHNNKPVTSIGYEAFYLCFSITSVIIPNSVNIIKDSAFYQCELLTSVIISNSVISIGDTAFIGCRSLTNIKIPNSVTSIGNYAFSSCSSLTSVTIGNSVKSIGYSAFASCDLLTSIKIPNSVTSIGDSAFSSCRSLTNIEIPNSVTRMGNSVFYCCESLESVEIPNSLTKIGDRVFNACYSLTNVTIGSSVTSIGVFAFAWCKSLESITIPNSVTILSSSAFAECDMLEKVNYLGTIDEWVQIEFDNYSSNPLSNGASFYIKNVYVSKANITTATKINSYAFYNCGTLSEVIIGNSVKSIGAYAFYGCYFFTAATFIDNSIWYITTSLSDWQNKTGGTVVDNTNPIQNATYFKQTYYNYYWYKL